MAEDWQMPRRGEMCTACQREFQPGESIQAYLFESDAGFERRDFCDNCEPPDAAFAVGHWRTQRPQPAAKTRQPFNREEIYRLFQGLEDADAPQKRRLRFLLGLLLWRKKALKLDRTEMAEGVEVWHYRTPGSADHHSVERPDLDEEQLETLGVQLEQVLAGGGQDTEGLLAQADEETEHSE